MIKKTKLTAVLLLCLILSSSFSMMYAYGKKPEHAIARSEKTTAESPSNNKQDKPGQAKKNTDPNADTGTSASDSSETDSGVNDSPTNNTETGTDSSTETDSTETNSTVEEPPANTEGETSTETPSDSGSATPVTDEGSQSGAENETSATIVVDSDDLNVYGVNYHSIWWHYNDAEGTTNEVLHRDFSLFKTQGVEIMTLLIQWSYMEPTRGNYRTSYIQDIQRVVTVASQYDIQCIIDFHTAGSFSMPGWTPRRLTDIVTDYNTRQAYLTMQRYVIGELDGPNVHSFHLFNEPYLTKSSDPGSTWLGVTRDQALDLLQELYDNAKTVTSKPCSIRYGCDSVMQSSQFADDPRVWSSSDYITVNYYMAYHHEYYLNQIISKAHSMSKKVMIGEFGYRDAVNNDDELQRQRVAEHISLFGRVGVDNAMAWIWRADKTIEDGSYAPVGGGYNLAANLMGDPRPAFYEIGRGNTPSTAS